MESARIGGGTISIGRRRRREGWEVVGVAWGGVGVWCVCVGEGGRGRRGKGEGVVVVCGGGGADDV